MQEIIRIIIFIVLILLFIFVIRRKIIKTKKQCLISITALSAVAVLLSIPFDNLFLSFDSYESAFKYFLNKGEIVNVTETDRSALIISYDKGDKKCLYLKKEGGKFKAPFKSPKFEMFWHNSEGHMLTYIEEPDTDNCFIMVTVLKENSVKVTDSRNTSLNVFTYGDKRDDIWCEYVIFAENADDNYYVQVGDEKVYLTGGKK